MQNAPQKLLPQGRKIAAKLDCFDRKRSGFRCWVCSARSGGIAERRMLHAVAAATCGFGMLALCASHGPDAMYPASRIPRFARRTAPMPVHPASRIPRSARTRRARVSSRALMRPSARRRRAPGTGERCRPSTRGATERPGKTCAWDLPSLRSARRR